MHTATLLNALTRAEDVHRLALRHALPRISEADATTLELAARSYVDAHRAHAIGDVSDDFIRRVSESWRRNLTRVAARSSLAAGEAITLDVSLLVLRYKLRAGSLFR